MGRPECVGQQFFRSDVVIAFSTIARDAFADAGRLQLLASGFCPVFCCQVYSYLSLAICPPRIPLIRSVLKGELAELAEVNEITAGIVAFLFHSTLLVDIRYTSNGLTITPVSLKSATINCDRPQIG